MPHTSRTTLRRLGARIIAALTLAGLVLTLGTASAQAVSVTSLEKNVINRAHGELVEGVYDVNNKLYPAGQPYDINAAWCGSFLNWIMKQAGVDPQGGGRGTWNVNVAKAWSIYGPKNGGYGRYASKHDAMPGDLLIYGYDGTATTGGHVTMVVANTSDRRYVHTIGGNEGDRVRLQKRDLSASGTYLVTLHEFRNRKADIWGESGNGNPMDYGDLYFQRTPNSTTGAPMVKATKIVYKGSTYEGLTLGNSGFTGKTNLGSNYTIGSIFYTRSYTYVNVIKGTDGAGMAQSEPVIDYSRVTTSGGTT